MRRNVKNFEAMKRVVGVMFFRTSTGDSILHDFCPHD